MIFKTPVWWGIHSNPPLLRRQSVLHVLMIALALASASCATSSKGAVSVNPKGTSVQEDWKPLEKGKASWYGGRWHGRKTANGERYNQHTMTAAHKRLPFGTKVRVTNISNGKSCVVRINNRGPYTKGRVIDLSVAAAKEIGIYSRGVGSVKLEVEK